MAPPLELTEDSKSAYYSSYPSTLGIVFIIVFYTYCGLMVFTLQITGTREDWPWLVHRSYLGLQRFREWATQPSGNGKQVGTIRRWAVEGVALTALLLVSLLHMLVWPITAVLGVVWLLLYAVWAVWYVYIWKGGEGAVARGLQSALEYKRAMPASAYCRRMMAAAKRGRQARQPNTQEPPREWSAPEGGIKLTVIVGKSEVGRNGGAEQVGQANVLEMPKVTQPKQPISQLHPPALPDRTSSPMINPSAGLSMIREESAGEAAVNQPLTAHLKPPKPWSPV